MRIGIIGINHKQAELKLREQLAIICQRRFGPGQSLHCEHACVLLSTCNRTEIYFSSEDLPGTHGRFLNILRQEISEDFDQKLYSYFGFDCFLHLTRVTAGLDSAILAETEIQGQVKTAYENTSTYQNLSPQLHYLFQKALKIAKQVRLEIPMGRGIPDLEHAVLQAGLQLFQNQKSPNILFVGASHINEKILTLLKNKHAGNITICNRSESMVETWMQKYAISKLPWEKLMLWSQFDWIICGTKSPHYLIKETSDLKEQMHNKLLIDLSVPRNVDPKLASFPNCLLFNIDQINQTLEMRRQHLNHLLVNAEEVISEAVVSHIRLYKQKEENKLRLSAAIA